MVKIFSSQLSTSPFWGGPRHWAINPFFYLRRCTGLELGIALCGLSNILWCGVGSMVGQIYKIACISDNSISTIYLNSHPWWWDVTNGQYNVRCIHLITQTRVINNPAPATVDCADISITTNPLSLVQWRGVAALNIFPAVICSMIERC